MAEIRPAERSDLSQAARLLSEHLGGRGTDEAWLAATMFDDPWADPDLSPLVAIEDGELIGFIGAQVRRIRVGDRSIRGVCCSQLVVPPGNRGGATGALLLSRMRAGGQELTWSDMATEGVVRIWRTFGGHVDHARAYEWMLALRPARWLGSIAAARARRRPIGRDFVPVAAFPFQAIAARVSKRIEIDLPEGVVGEDARTESLIEAMPLISRRLKLWVEHDREHLDHLFGLIESFYETELVRRLVRQNGRAIGWYAYLRASEGATRVLHVAADPEAADSVLGELVEHARAAGAAVLTGRADPHLSEALNRRFAVLGFGRRPVIHAQEPELAALLQSESSLLTRLDGEVFGA